MSKALYARLDAQAYVRRLESELTDRGVDVAKLKAKDVLVHDGGDQGGATAQSDAELAHTLLI